MLSVGVRILIVAVGALLLMLLASYPSSVIGPEPTVSVPGVEYAFLVEWKNWLWLAPWLLMELAAIMGPRRNFVWFCGLGGVIVLSMLAYPVIQATRPELVHPSFKEMLRYLKCNRFLIVALVALLLLGLASLEQKMAIYMGRICLEQENMATLVAGGAAVSVILVSALVPVLSKKWDKFYVLCAGMAFTVVMNVVAYFVGYDSLVLAILMTMLKCAGLGFWSVVIYMLVADTVEYGTYKTGTRAAGITFSLQCFAAKLKNGLIGTVVLFSLAAVGFVEGENAVQPAGVADGVWGLFCLLPAAGYAVALIMLLVWYKLRSKDVQVMSQYNNGQISKEEAEAILAEKYGPAGERQ